MKEKVTEWLENNWLYIAIGASVIIAASYIL